MPAPPRIPVVALPLPPKAVNLTEPKLVPEVSATATRPPPPPFRFAPPVLPPFALIVPVPEIVAALMFTVPPELPPPDESSPFALISPFTVSAPEMSNLTTPAPVMVCVPLPEKSGLVIEP